jgi:hypothetical protein
VPLWLVPPSGDVLPRIQSVPSSMLYRAAKPDPGRRFHALWDKVLRRDVLWRAWFAVRRNNGAPGIDKTNLADVEEYGAAQASPEDRAPAPNRGWFGLR